MNTFNKIAEAHGSNSQAEKIDLLGKLLFDAEKDEGKYIIRWIDGNLKIGAAEQTIIASLARAVCMTPFNQLFENAKINMRDITPKPTYDELNEKAEANIKRAISEYPNYETLMDALTKVGAGTDSLKEFCYIRPGKYLINNAFRYTSEADAGKANKRSSDSVESFREHRIHM